MSVDVTLRTASYTMERGENSLPVTYTHPTPAPDSLHPQHSPNCSSSRRELLQALSSSPPLFGVTPLSFIPHQSCRWLGPPRPAAARLGSDPFLGEQSNFSPRLLCGLFIPWRRQTSPQPTNCWLHGPEMSPAQQPPGSGLRGSRQVVAARPRPLPCHWLHAACEERGRLLSPLPSAGELRAGQGGG